MKAFSLSHIALSLLLCLVAAGIYGCNSSAKNATTIKSATTSLKDLDKQALLNMVDSVSQLLGKKGSTLKDVTALIKTYQSNYRFTLSSAALTGNESGDVIVNITNRSDHLVMFALSPKFQRQLSFTDLKRKFGVWKTDVLAKEPVVIPVLFSVRGRDTVVQIIAASNKFPEEKNSVIKYITVSR